MGVSRLNPGLWCVVLAVAAAGCASEPKPAGSDRELTAVYVGGTLRTDLGGAIRAPAVAAAAGEALRDRGYAVTGSKVTEDAAEVSGRAPGAGRFETVTISARAWGDGTRVRIEYGLWGDQARSRALMDAVLSRLGL